MDKFNLQRIQNVSDLQRQSQQQFILQRDPKQLQNAQNPTKLPVITLQEAIEKVRQMEGSSQNIFQKPPPLQYQNYPVHLQHRQNQQMQSNLNRQNQQLQPIQQNIILQHQQFQPNVNRQNLKIQAIQQHQQIQSIQQNANRQHHQIQSIQQNAIQQHQQIQSIQQNRPNLQSNFTMHHPTNNQNYSAQQFRSTQLGKETPLQFYHPQKPGIKIISNEYFTNNPEKHFIYPSNFNITKTVQHPTLTPMACPPLTPIKRSVILPLPIPPPTEIAPIQEKTVQCAPLSSQLIPFQDIPMPNLTEFHQQLSDIIEIIDVLPSPNILSEELDIKPEIIENVEPDPGEFLKTFLSDAEVPRNKSKRKRTEINWETLLDSDDADDHELKTKRQKKLHTQSVDPKAQKVVENKINYLDIIRPCSVKLTKLMLTMEDMPVIIVNDKIVKIRKPRMKTVATSYNKITNIGFIEYPKGIAYKCLLQTCRFQSYDQEVFEKHLINHHSEDTFTEFIGYCCTCSDFITSKSLIEEFDHLLENHLQAKKKDRCDKKELITLEEKSGQLDAEEILAIKEVLDTFEEIVADIDTRQEVMSDIEELPEDEDKPLKSRKVKKKPIVEKEPNSIAGRMIFNRRKTIDISLSRYSNSIDDKPKQLPSVTVNSSNDGKIKMTIKNSFTLDKHKKKKDKKLANLIPLTPPESCSNYTDSDFSENSTLDYDPVTG